MQHVYLFSVSSHHNPDDDSGDEYSGDPVSDLTVFADRDTAILHAQQYIAGERESYTPSDELIVRDVGSGREGPLPCYVVIETPFSITYVTVSRLEVKGAA